MPTIRKTPISTGMYWVEAPEADVRILCGCPADSVKHLLKRGLIAPQEVEGVPCETGPNAILLSDVMVQNGEFSNLAEFPVLQMLYRQGLLLPNHPNNTGAKPMLIGQSQQVNAQLQYIYRGNYGLVSKAELVQAGAEEDVAEELMRLKLRFAFGSIRPSSDLLEARVVGNDVTEIRNGVTIQRASVNVFEIRYGADAVTVDLNLGPDETYESAYPLGFKAIEREYFGVIHSGEADGWDINRPTVSSILMFQGRIYLIDAGPNLLANLDALGIGIGEIAGMFHTHAHDDHFAGITTLMRSGHKIPYYAASLVRASVEKKMAALLSIEEERFADFLEPRDLEVGVWNDVDGLEVRPILSPHPVETNILLFRALCGDGYKTYAHFADIVALDVLEGMVTDADTGPGVTREFHERVKESYLTPADLKKVDVGGGMIHGSADDFRDDTSGKIILAHLARELTSSEKEIGSSAPHGTADVLVPARSDFARRDAEEHLHAHFSGVAAEDLGPLLNGDIVRINPGTIVLRQGAVPDDVLLILSGTLERVQSSQNVVNKLSAGAIIGTAPVLESRASSSTYRAISFVRALAVPAALYATVVRQSGLEERIRQSAATTEFLRTTQLFGEDVPEPTLAAIADGVQIRQYAAGKLAESRDLGVLNVVTHGRLERVVGNDVLDTVEAREFFGEEEAVFGTPGLFRVRAVEDTETLQIPGDLVEDIPIVRWKLFESYLARASMIVHAGDQSQAFIWRDEFSVQNTGMDTHHMKLVEIANSIAEILRTTQDRDALDRAMGALVDYTHYHFSAEEELMGRYQYPGLPSHRAKHRRLEQQVAEYREGIEGRETLDDLDFTGFLERWLISHVLDTDRRYGAFLNAQGVF